MVVEHTFVTTLDAPQTMQAAMQFLQSRGFDRSSSAFPMGGEWDTLEMRRGKKNAARAKNVTQLPQVAHVNWDRGRVTVVLSIEPSYVWGGASTAAFGLTAGTEKPKKMKLHAQMLSGIASGLEQLLVHNAAPDTAAQQWMYAEEEAFAAARRRFRRNLIITLVIVLGFVALIALLMNVK